jgi:tryptophan-rich sensory protein
MTQRTAGTTALAAACTGLVLVPNLGALLGPGEQTDRYDTVVTPPDYAFVVWAPIFAACAADAVGRWRRPGDAPVSDHATALPLTVAYTLNTAWSVTAQTDRFRFTPALLTGAAASAALAHRRVQAQVRPRPSTVLATGLLLGWTSLASAVNLAADVVRRGVPRESTPAVATGALGVGAVTTLLAGTVARSRYGALPLAASAGWGLLTAAADHRRPAGVRLLAAASAAALAAAATRAPG